MTEGARRKRGAPPDIPNKPPLSQAAYEAAIAREHDEAVEHDPLVKMVGARDRPDDIAAETIMQAARSAASIKWDQKLAFQRGRYEAAAKLSSRRIKALKDVADLIIQRHRNSMLGDGLDLESEPLRRIETLFRGLVAQAAEDALPASTARQVVERFTERMDKSRIENRPKRQPPKPNPESGV